MILRWQLGSFAVRVHLSNLSGGILIAWPTILAGISLFVEVARHSQYHGFHSCVLRREHFVKTHLHRVYLRCHSFSHYCTQDFMNVGKHEDRNTG